MSMRLQIPHAASISSRPEDSDELWALIITSFRGTSAWRQQDAGVCFRLVEHNKHRLLLPDQMFEDI